jgi:hypothetical protein
MNDENSTSILCGGAMLPLSLLASSRELVERWGFRDVSGTRFDSNPKIALLVRSSIHHHHSRCCWLLDCVPQEGSRYDTPTR